MTDEIDLSDPYPVVILGNGEFPTHEAPLRILQSARTLICTDGSVHTAIENSLSPSLVIGDMDSLKTDLSHIPVRAIHQKEQDNTDLEKALNWCVKKDITAVILVGVTGQRDDQTVVSFLVAKEYADRLNVTVVTDYFTVSYVQNEKTFLVERGQRVSILSTGNRPLITTKGLKFGLDNKPLRSSGHGMSNEALSDEFSITVTQGGVLVFISHLP